MRVKFRVSSLRVKVSVLVSCRMMNRLRVQLIIKDNIIFEK